MKCIHTSVEHFNINDFKCNNLQAITLESCLKVPSPSYVLFSSIDDQYPHHIQTRPSFHAEAIKLVSSNSIPEGLLFHQI